MKGVLANQVHNPNVCQKDKSVWRYCGDELYTRTIIWFSLSAIFLGFISEFNRIDLDVFHQIALIREIMKTGSFFQKDIFSYTSTISPVIHHEWGAGAILYFLIVKQGLGENGLLILKYLLTIIVCMGTYIFAKRKGANDYIFAFVAFWGIILGRIGFTTIRAQLYSLLFLVVLLFLIEENRKGKKWPLLALLPPYIIWVNIHGGFLIGLGLFVIYIFELFFSSFLLERDFVKSLSGIKYQIITLVAMCLATVLNPYGIGYISTIYHAITLDRTPYIAEWRPIWKICFTTFNVYLLTIIILLYVWYRNKHFLLLPGSFFLIITACLALRHYRHLSIYSIIFMCYVPALLESTELSNLIKNKYKKIFCFVFMLIGLVGIVMASSNQFWLLRIPTTPKKNDNNVLVYPVGAVEYLKDKKFTGNMMIPFNVGAYASWHLYPHVKVSMDSRFEAAYTPAQVAENINFYAAEAGWQKTLERYPTDAILVPNWKPIEEILSENETQKLINFQKVYVDDGYAIYMRADLAEKYPFLDNRGKTIIGTFP
jgi:hypothetical protein